MYLTERQRKRLFHAKDIIYTDRLFPILRVYQSINQSINQSLSALCAKRILGPIANGQLYKESGTLTDDFSVIEATFNLKLAECMRSTCSNLIPRLPKNQSNALICDFYWRLSHIHIYTH